MEPEEYIQFEPETERGELPARFGRGEARMVGMPDGGYQRRHRTPNELAAWKLNQALEKYPEFTKQGREDAQNEFVSMPDLRTMNMKVLAGTLNFLRSVNNNPTPESFKDENIGSHIAKLLPVKTLSPEEKQRLTVRFKAQILMYIRAIQEFRQPE